MKLNTSNWLTNGRTLKLINANFHSLEDAIQNLKWVNIIQFWQNGG